MRLALCRWRARTPLPSGTSAAWEPDIDLRGYSSVAAIDLRSSRDDSGFCVVGVPDADAPIRGAFDLGDDPFDLAPRRLADVLGVNLYERRVGRIVRELLPELQPERHGGRNRERVWLGDIKLYDSLGNLPDELAATYFAETFNKADGIGLGPLLVWDNQLGQWQTISNEASFGAATFGTAVAQHDVGSANLFAEATVRFLTAGGYAGGVTCRAVNGRYSFVIQETNYAEISHHDVNFVWSFVASATPVINVGTNYVVYGEANGSTLTLKLNGATIASGTNTALPSGQRGGILMYADALLANQIRIDNFATAIIGETAPGGSAFATRRGRYVQGIGGRW